MTNRPDDTDMQGWHIFAAAALPVLAYVFGGLALDVALHILGGAP